MQTFNGSIDIFHASAGTGKTHILMEKVAEAVGKGVPLEKIAFVTYTKKAAVEAQERASERFGVPIAKLTNFRTIHSMCFKSLQMTRFRMMDVNKYREFSEETGFNLGRLIMNVEDGFELNSFKDNQVVLAEQLYRNNRKMFDVYTSEVTDYTRFNLFIQLYYRYKQKNNYCDFTDLLEMYLAENLTEDIEVACLDEMQDSTPLQWKVVMQAFSNAKQIYVAGDNKQALYSFNGGDDEILLNLRGIQHVLDVTYRVPNKILEFVQERIISDMPKVIQDTSYCTSYKQGGDVIHLAQAEEFIDDFDSSKSYYLLSRNRSQRKIFKDICIQNGINFIMEGKAYFSSKDAKDFIMNNYDDWDEEKVLFAKDYMKDKTIWDCDNIRDPLVTISTIHGVKGGEADRVVLLTDVSPLVYKGFDIRPMDMHSVFYVACTRAKESLYIVDPQTHRAYTHII